MDYIDFLNVIRGSEYATYFLLSLITLFTFFQKILFGKRSLSSFLFLYTINSLVLLLFFFYKKSINPISNFTSARLNEVIINNFPNRFILSNSLIGMNILLLLFIIFKRNKVRYDIAEHSSKVINWCVENYPKSGFKKYPKLIICNHLSKNKGEYHHNEKKIIIYKKNVDSINDLTNSVIHEYFHFYLDHGKSNQVYHEKLQSIGYEDHPEELICNLSADKLTELFFEQNEV
jgi:hypothetical protein